MQTSIHVRMEGMIREWHRKNPLRIWQMQSDLSQDVITQILGVGPRTWQCWATGLYPPNKENWAKLVKLIGDEQMPQKWDEWHATKPDVMALVS